MAVMGSRIVSCPQLQVFMILIACTKLKDENYIQRGEVNKPDK